MIEFGHLATVLALALSLLAFVSALLGAKWDASFTAVGRLAFYATTVLLVFGCGTLIYAFVTNDFSVLYVAMNSNTKLPLFYRIAALWGGHEGSLLLWVTLVSLFASLAVSRHWKVDPDFIAPVIVVLALVQVGFLSLVVMLSNPFERLIPAAAQGRDLNPLLQDPQMVLHPPMLFAGYTGFAVPFAFAVAVLLTGRGADRWIFVARRWILLAWVALTIGIALGGHWAYRELGWGGYWAWDPVENASFMPWLVGTALLHSVMVQEQRRTFRVWNLALAVTAFALSILGTFLVRSGIISSVHAFASDPGRGLYLLGFFVAILAVSFGMLVWRANRLQTESAISPGMSRESLFLYNNLIFLVAMFTVLLGTLFPLVSELFADTKVTVAAPFFNKTFVPIMIVNLLLMAVAPMVPWRSFTWARIWQVIRIPLVAGVIGAAVAAALGVLKPVPLASIFTAVFGMGVVLQEWAKVSWARAGGSAGGIFPAIVKMFSSNRRRYGGLLAHLGVLVMVLGFVGSYAYQKESDVALQTGDRTQIGDYDLLYKGTNEVSGPNWQGFAGHFEVYRDGELVTRLDPEKRFYTRSDMPTTEPQRHKSWTHELYVTLGDVDIDSGSALVKIYLNPLVHLVWLGVVMLVGGGLLGLSHRVRLRRSV
jgi:cytochrome c-type biogenesis protein CcmF